MGTSAPHIQSQVHRHRANWRGLVVVLILAVVIALVGVSRMEACCVIWSASASCARWGLALACSA